MRKQLLGVLLASFAGLSQAQTVTCEGQWPMLTMTYSTGADAGSPGLLYLGLLAPSQGEGGFWDLNDVGQPYTGGLAIPNRRYDAGLPATISIKRPFPEQDTYRFQGWTVYVGHGALTQQDMALVKQRRETLAAAKPARVAAGTWNPAYDDDEQYMRALVERNMRKNNKYHAVTTVPALDCRPSSS
nr:hypothetical protein [Cupriavidus gilardii]